jgi:hypothetical protein
MAAVAGALTRPTRAGIGSLWCWERRRHGGERTRVTDRLDARSAQTPSDPRVPRRLRTRGRAPKRLPGAPRRMVLRALPARRMGTACLRPPSARARHCVSHSREVAAGRDTFLRAVRPAQPTADLVRVGSVRPGDRLLPVDDWAETGSQAAAVRPLVCDRGPLRRSEQPVVRRPDDVEVPGWARPRAAAVLSVFDPPTGVVFGVVVALA